MSLVITTTGTATLDPYLLINRLFHLFLILHYLLLAFNFGEFPATARDSCLACVSQYMSVEIYRGAPRLIPAVVWGAQNSSTYFRYHKLRQSRLTIYTYVIAPGLHITSVSALRGFDICLKLVLFISLQSSLISLTSSLDLPENRSLICLRIVRWSAWESSFDLFEASFVQLESVFWSAWKRLLFNSKSSFYLLES